MQEIAIAGGIGARFHRAVALSGGVLQNGLLLRLALHGMRDKEFGLITHRRVTPNDGGIALGRRLVGNSGKKGRAEMCLAVPGKILSVEDRDGTLMSVVDFGGIKKDVCLQYIPDAEVGQYVVVHVGFAIQCLDEESAMRTLAEFEHLGVLKEEFADGFVVAAKQAGMENPSKRDKRP